MRIIFLVVLVFMMSGCAAMSVAPPNRWVNDNTLYSDKLPRLEIKVDPSLSFSNIKKSNKLRTSDTGRQHAGIKTSEFFFTGGSTALKIQIESLPPSSSNSYMLSPDYSNHQSNIISGNIEMNGMRFVTGVMATVFDGMPAIYKAYGRVIGGTTIYQILYIEQLEKKWEHYDKSLLTNSDQDLLNAFNERADKSFSIRDYSPQKPK